jgi:hypothetical protein
VSLRVLEAHGQTKSRKSARSNDPVEELIEEPPLATTNLSSTDQVFLRRIVRFLVNILTPAYADKARREGYSSKEHTLGWQLWRTAAGETRPFEHWLREQEVSDGVDVDSAEQRRLLQEIDNFENTWFPRTRAIIRRVVDKDRRDRFAAAFFKDLVQQPLGPAVVGSVSTYVTRIEGLDASAEGDAKAVRAMLRSRGLTDGRIADVKRLLKEAQVGGKSGPKNEAPVSAAELEQARTAQLEAVGDLRDWFNDWGTTLRSRFGPRDQVRLGLVVRRNGGFTTEEDAEEEAEGSEEGTEEPDAEAAS